MIDCTNNKGADICVILGPTHFENSINAFLPRLYTLWSHPEAQEVCLFNKVLTIGQITLHVVGMEVRKHRIDHF